MRTRIALAVLLATSVAVTGVVGCSSSVVGQGQNTGMPRTSDGKPDFSGIWQAMNSANWNLQAHAASKGPVVALGAAFSVPAGPGVVEGNEIPYLPAALAKKQENGANWMARDPEVKCFMPGVPRMMYMPYPIQIAQGRDAIFMTTEFASASRTIGLNTTEKSPYPSWMGWNVAKWDGDTLVIDVTDQMDQTWFDRAGNYHGEDLHVVERYTLTDR